MIGYFYTIGHRGATSRPHAIDEHFEGFKRFSGVPNSMLRGDDPGKAAGPARPEFDLDVERPATTPPQNEVSSTRLGGAWRHHLVELRGFANEQLALRGGQTMACGGVATQQRQPAFGRTNP